MRLALILALLATPLAAKTLTPANPQPDTAALKPGLFVEYVPAPDVRTLDDARKWKAGKYRGPDLIGFDYPDTEPGENALTSDQAEKIIAHIKGYMRFDAPGSYELDFLSNDGIEAIIGGQEVSRFSGRQTCNNVGVETVQVPEAGWYEVKVLWYQRLNTSCLLMEWTPPGGELDWVPNENFAYVE
ncbi:MAG: PA14 domain-containing protein [Pseudomonadota bacterium]